MCRRHSPICIEEESAASTYNRGTISPLCGEDTVSSVYRRGEATLSFVHMRHSMLIIESMSPSTTSRGTFSPVCREDNVYNVQRRSLPPSHLAMGLSLPCVDNVIVCVCVCVCAKCHVSLNVSSKVSPNVSLHVPGHMPKHIL